MPPLILSPARTVRSVASLFVNTSGKTRIFGYLPPRGKNVAAGATVSFAHDLTARGVGNRTGMTKRQADALTRDMNAGNCQVFVFNKLLMSLAGRTASPLAVGDMVWLDTTAPPYLVRPASEFTWTTDLPTTQGNFVNQFLGICATAKAAGVAGNVAVDVSDESMYLMACTAQTNQPGDGLGPAKDVGNNLVNQTVVKAATLLGAVARSMQQDAANVTSVLLNIQSAYFGSNDAARQ